MHLVGGGSQKKVQTVFVAIIHEVTLTYYILLVNCQNPGGFRLLLFLGGDFGDYNGDYIVFCL